MNRRNITIGAVLGGGLAATAAAAVLLFGGGSGRDGVDLKTSPAAAVRAAADATQKAKTAQVDTVVTMTTPAVAARGASPAQAAKTTTMHGTGLFDFDRQVGRIDLAMAGGGLQEVLTPAALYLRPAADAGAARGTTSGKGWSRVDITHLADGNLISGGATDPSMTFALLTGAAPDVAYVGPDTVRDTAVAHYRGTVDLAEAASVAGTGPDAAVAAADKRALTNASHAFVTARIPFDVYLDANGRVRRFVATFQFVMPGPAHTVARVVSSTELYSFGLPVGVVAAPVQPSSSATSVASASGHHTGASSLPSPSRSHK